MVDGAGAPAGVAGSLVRALVRLGPSERAKMLAALRDDEVLALAADWDAAVQTDLGVWCCEALEPFGQAPARHHRLLIDELERISAPEGSAEANDRLMVMMPPGSAKSTYASILMPAWFMQRHPRCGVIGASHTADLAEDFSRRILGLVREHGRLLGMRLATENVGAWSTRAGATYKAAGVGGPITGRRADLAIVDDPFKSRAEADSEPVRRRVWDWFRADLLTRLKPGGRVVLIMTRWHEDDLAGRLLDHEGDQWRVLCLPALADPGDPLGRGPGEPLWPDWEGLEDLEKKRRTLGEREWSALFQQQPRPDQGILFDVSKIVVLDEAPACARSVRGWDLAATEAGSGNPDWTVGSRLGRTPEGRFVVLDVQRLRGRPEVVERALVRTAEADGRGVPISLPQDPGQAGKHQAAYLARALAGFVVRTSRESGAKETRAAPFAAQVNAGNVGMVRGAWNRDLIEELRSFPAGRKDDQVDSLSRGFMELAEAGAPARRVSLPLMAR